MSVKVMDAVKRLPVLTREEAADPFLSSTKLTRAEKSFLWHIADYADKDGRNIYPKIKTLTEETGKSERQSKELLKSLRLKGFLLPIEDHTKRSVHYHIPLDAFEDVAPRPPVLSEKEAADLECRPQKAAAKRLQAAISYLLKAIESNELSTEQLESLEGAILGRSNQPPASAIREEPAELAGRNRQPSAAIVSRQPQSSAVVASPAVSSADGADVTADDSSVREAPGASFVGGNGADVPHTVTYSVTADVPAAAKEDNGRNVTHNDSSVREAPGASFIGANVTRNGICNAPAVSHELAGQLRQGAIPETPAAVYSEDLTTNENALIVLAPPDHDEGLAERQLSPVEQEIANLEQQEKDAIWSLAIRFPSKLDRRRKPIEAELQAIQRRLTVLRHELAGQQEREEVTT